MYEFSHKRNLFPVPIIVTTKSLNRLVHIFSFSIVSFIWVNGHSSHLGSHKELVADQTSTIDHFILIAIHSVIAKVVSTVDQTAI